jgi:hypothetical protein
MSDQYICRKACKEFALRWARDNRTGWMPERVAKQFLDDLNTMVRTKMQSAISHHPTIGKTIRYYF